MTVGGGGWRCHHRGSWDAVAVVVITVVVGIVVDSRTASWLLWCCGVAFCFDIVMVVGRLCCCLSGCRRRSPVTAGESPAGLIRRRRTVFGYRRTLSLIWSKDIPGLV